MKRRNFIKTAGGVASGIALHVKHLSAAMTISPGEYTSNGMLPRRELGNTGEQLSVIGFPGNGLRHYDQQESTAGILKAIERGVNFFDVAPAYGKDGEAEKKMGVALQGHRDKVFLACKTKKRDAAGAREELERSLKRLKTDHFDLYQMHFLASLTEVEQAFGPGGAIETLVKAREEGKVRYLGFSAHTTVAAMTAMNHFKFDTVMYPVNYVEHFSFGFGHAVLELARNQGVSVIAIKPTSGGSWSDDVPREQRRWWFKVIDDQTELNMALRFSLSQKNVISAIPASFLDHLDMTITAAEAYKPISKKELTALHGLAKTRTPVFLQQQKRGLMGHHNPHDHDESMMG